MFLALALAATVASASPGPRNPAGLDTAMCKAMRGLSIEMGQIKLPRADSLRLAAIRKAVLSGQSILSVDSIKALMAAKDRILGYEPTDTAVRRAIKSILMPPTGHTPRSDSINNATLASMRACSDTKWLSR